MAVLRPDQAQLTFAAEVGPGGDPETGTITDKGSPASTFLSVIASPGSRTITVDGESTFIVGDFIRIGSDSPNIDVSEREVRRIERISGLTFTLDRPLAFYHTTGSTEEVVECVGYAAPSANGGDTMITWVPGVYETVDTPDPDMSIEPRYFLGTQAKRDFFSAYKGQQTFSGNLSGIVLLNGWPLRFPFGKVTTVGGTSVGSSTALSGAHKKGDLYINVDSASTFSVDDYIVINFQGTNTPLHNVDVRRVVAKSSNRVRLNAPLAFDHANDLLVQKVSTAGFFYHHIVETVDLDSMSWHIRMADSSETDANAFIRRYVGGKVGSASIAAEEGGLVTMNWDSVLFMDMLNNQDLHAIAGDQAVTMYGTQSAQNDVGGADVNMPGFAIMHDIQASHICDALASTDATSGGIVKSGFPTDEPYYFSQGTVTFWGEAFARVRSFSISVNNNEEARYYISGQYGRHRGPSEIREQRREYGMSCVLALPDTEASTSGGLGSATALFRELLLEGTYDTSTMKGFKIQLDFEKSNGDAIRIYLPGLDPTTSPTLGASLTEPARTLTGSGNEQGCFIRRAEHAIGGESPLQIEADILFRNMHIIVKDKNPLYP